MCGLGHEIRALGTDWWTNVGQDETFGDMLRIQTNLQTHIDMALHGIPLQHEPDRLREFQTLIRHVHQRPTQMRRALRLAFKELPVHEAQTLRDWVERRFSL